MKILVIMKRFGANMDMPAKGFGRQIRLFGSFPGQVDFLCPDYKQKETKLIKRNGARYFIRPLSLGKLHSFLKFSLQLCRENRYDAIIGTTDPLLSIFGYFLARKTGAKYACDVQDDYSVYASYRLPFVPLLDRHVIRHSDAVLSAAPTLTEKLRKMGGKNVHTIVEGVDLKEIRIMDKKKCRSALKLKQDIQIVTYIGHISKLKGADFIFRAFAGLREEFPKLHLLLVGKIDSNVKAELGKRVIYIPFLERAKYAMALNASDVLIIPNSRNAFSYYSFPYKLLEYMAVNKPIVAADIGNIGIILRQFKDSLYEPDNADDFAEKFRRQIAKKEVHYRKATVQYGWEKLSQKAAGIINDTIANRAGPIAHSSAQSR